MLLYKILINLKNMQRNNSRQCHTLLGFLSFLIRRAFVGFTHVFFCLVVCNCLQWCSALSKVGFAPLNCNQSDLIITPKSWFAVSTL